MDKKERIFMFLDLVSSTTIAEKIGHINFHKLLNDFFFDITEPIIESDGEIYKYVGDEVIGVWAVKDKKTNFNCINSYFEIEEIINNYKAKYLKKYNLVPEFRVGMHCGPVVAGEMGDYKQEIAFLGDVVNTSARIQAETKVRQCNILISEDLLNKIEVPKHIEVHSIGMVRLKGKENELELFSISKINN